MQKFFKKSYSVNTILSTPHEVEIWRKKRTGKRKNGNEKKGRNINPIFCLNLEIQILASKCM